MIVQPIEGPVLRLFYSSLRAEATPRGGWPVHLDSILQVSRTNNAAAHVTGALICVENTFLQILEGPVEAVGATFERIACDFRHGDISLLELGRVERRLFPEWGMAHLSDEDGVTLELRDDLQDIRLIANTNAREALKRIRLALRAARTGRRDESSPGRVVVGLRA